MPARGSFRRQLAWALILGGVAAACGGDTTSGATASLTGGTGGTATGGTATAGAGGADVGGAETGGGETGGTETGGASAADCTELTSALQSALDAFVPVSSNSCILDSDCAVVHNTVIRNSRRCWGVSPMSVGGHFGNCPRVVAAQYGAEWSAFLANDPAITAVCDALRTAGCAPWSSSCPCAILDPGVCGSPQCVSGVCQ
jgi:hypothetical protein